METLHKTHARPVPVQTPAAGITAYYQGKGTDFILFGTALYGELQS